jgi:hypothetical protein
LVKPDRTKARTGRFQSRQVDWKETLFVGNKRQKTKKLYTSIPVKQLTTASPDQKDEFPPKASEVFAVSQGEILYN